MVNRATNKVLRDGVEIKDPKEAIMALQAPIEEAVQRVRKGSLELVGVTSAELIPLLQIVSGQASQIGAHLNEASDLTLDFAASMGTLNIPLYQSRQEITSILTETIDMNSQLAKSLNITNQQVNAWKAQGVLVEKLRERMKALREGNALAAKTLEGVTSNIAEIFSWLRKKRVRFCRYERSLSRFIRGSKLRLTPLFPDRGCQSLSRFVKDAKVSNKRQSSRV